MNAFERACLAIRHTPGLDRCSWLWDACRPGYDAVLKLCHSRGVERRMNGQDTIRLLPRFRTMGEEYERRVWTDLFSRVGPGDVVVDAGAFIGLYTIALAKRVGWNGKVVAFEPDPENFAVLLEHVHLNGVSDRVQLHEMALGTEEGQLWFDGGRESESHVGSLESLKPLIVRSSRLDQVLSGQRTDLIKIDVEGFEQAVLEGARHLLCDERLAPRLLYIETHPYAWSQFKSSSDEILSLLEECGYAVQQLDGAVVTRIESYGTIRAIRRQGH